MKILVNIDCLIPPLTGVGRYAQGILRELVKSPEVEDIQAFSTFGLFNRAELSDILASSAGLVQADSTPGAERTLFAARLRALVVVLLNRFKPLLRKIPGIRRLRQFVRSQRVASQQDRFKGFVYWEPNYLLADINCPAVAVIHDVSHDRLPQFHPADRLQEMAQRLPLTLKQSVGLIAVSEFTRAEIVDLYAPSQEIAIVNPAVDPEFFDVRPEDVERVKSKYQLPKQFVLSLGTLEPRKNVLGLITAYKKLPESVQTENPLIMMGAKGWLSPEAQKLIDSLEAKSRLRYLGYVPQEDVPAVLASASVMAYPSLYEGFGMPVAEAMAAGTAVLTSDRASMPEVAKGAACLVNPESTDSIREGLLQLLGDVDYRKMLEGRAIEVARGYTWQRSAGQLLEVLAQAQRHLN